MTAAAQHIPGVGTVYLPVSDQDRALAFYRDMLGFEVRSDSEFGEGFRWIEVAPAGAYTVIALVLPMREEDPQPGGRLRARGQRAARPIRIAGSARRSMDAGNRAADCG